jgi:hypothetical protein
MRGAQPSNMNDIKCKNGNHNTTQIRLENLNEATNKHRNFLSSLYGLVKS